MKRLFKNLSILLIALGITLLTGCDASNNENNIVTLPPDSSFSIQFIDVGQGDAALIQCDEHYMLIDGGNVGDSNLIYSVLQNNSIKHLDIVVGTHAHEDHIGGLPGALEYADADKVLSPVTEYNSKAFENFKKYADKKGGGLIIPSVGDEFNLGSAKVTVVGVNSGEDTNNTSIVLKIVYGETKFLFTGDVERDGEEVILGNGFDLSADVLKVGHHGSDTSTSYPFLREVMPKYAVISVGEGNKYEHPTDATLSKLRDAEVEFYRTDLNGDILCVSDGKKVTFTVTKTTSEKDLLTSGNGVVSSNPSNNTEDANSNIDEGEYVLNTKTKKFHLNSCDSAKDISDSNKAIYIGNRYDLIDDGYEACKKCNP